jgi:hypothetical protein
MGKSICAYTVDVTGISLTSEAVREVVFTETRTYDVAKLAGLTSSVGALFARLFPLPVEAVADKTLCPDKNPRCSQYHFAVIDPADGTSFVLDRTIRGGVQHMQQSSREEDVCSCYSAVFPETASRAARARKLTIDDVWAGIPSGLARHRQFESQLTAEFEWRRVATLQLFDDGWRVLDISPPPRDAQ